MDVRRGLLPHSAVLGGLPVDELVLGLAPRFLRREEEFGALFWTLTVELAAAGLVFVLFPIALMFPLPSWKFETGLRLRTRNLTTTCSLRSRGLACTTAAFGARRALAAGCRRWAFAVAASTVLTHQHHVADAVGGWAWPPPPTASSSSGSPPPTPFDRMAR